MMANDGCPTFLTTFSGRRTAVGDLASDSPGIEPIYFGQAA